MKLSEQETEVRYLTAREVCNRLHVTASQLANWRLRGGGPVFYKMGGSIRYRLEDIDEFEHHARRAGGNEQ